MEEKEYYNISKEKDLPLRCPIINYCSRRAWTIYLFSEYSKSEHNLNMVEALQKDGVIPSDFEKNKIMLQGESPSIIRGNNNFYFSDVCPEVNLFDGWNAMIPGKACTKGDYDKYYKNEKTRVIKSQHFSECAEYNKYLFDNDKIYKQRKKSIRKTIPYKTKALLQKEIHSKCPFCDNKDVDHFQIHHINENPSNNEFDNLLMLCPICHSKITKKELTTEEVKLVKKNLSTIFERLEFINVFIDELFYNWQSDKKNDYIFYSKFNENSISPHLTLNWSFVNHFKKTIILKAIIYSGKHLHSGLSGPAIPTIINSLIKYKIHLKLNGEEYKQNFIEQIQVPENQGFQFQTEFFDKFGNQIYDLSGRFYLDITFEFSNNQKIKIPRLYFNCKTENEKLEIYSLS